MSQKQNLLEKIQKIMERMFDDKTIVTPSCLCASYFSWLAQAIVYTTAWASHNCLNLLSFYVRLSIPSDFRRMSFGHSLTPPRSLSFSTHEQCVLFMKGENSNEKRNYEFSQLLQLPSRAIATCTPTLCYYLQMVRFGPKLCAQATERVI